MYLRVKSKENKVKFMNLWKEIAKGRQLPVTDLEERSEAFILQNKDGKSVGTIEFIPCNSISEFSGDLIDISSDKRILDNIGQTYQVRKMGVKKELVSKFALLDLLKIAALHAKNNNVQYYVSYLEKRHFESLTKKFKFRLEQIGDEVKLKKKVCVPALIDVEDAITNTKGYPIHIKSIVYMVRGTKKVKSLFA
ncbi:hypothetical protein [Halalkalibacter flavus]|uniref:hypothetical protein n=1 Tax=Halalkalibacter flavus TaxID=3090668 RepID=UPI002FCAA4E8